MEWLIGCEDPSTEPNFNLIYCTPKSGKGEDMVGVEKLEARNQIDRKTIFKVITRQNTHTKYPYVKDTV